MEIGRSFPLQWWLLWLLLPALPLSPQQPYFTAIPGGLSPYKSITVLGNILSSADR